MFKIIVECSFGDNFEENHQSAEDTSKAIERLLKGPFAQMGGIKSFKVFDSDGFLTFHVKNNKVIFPDPNTLKSEYK